jgi:hypothetical protein
MKKVFLFFGLIMALVSQAQFPSTITSGNSSTLQKANGAFGSAIGYVFAGTYGDTTAANVSFIKNVPGIVIRIGDDLWIRNNAATAWIKIGAGSIPPLNQYQVGVGNASNQLSGSTDLQFQDGGLSVNNTGGNDGVINYGYSIMKHNFGVSNPASGYSTIYVDAADGHIKQKTSSGTVYDLTDNGSGSGTVNSGTQYRLGYYATTGTALSEAAAITGNRALVSDANGVPTHSATTATQLGYLSTLTSNAQTQLDARYNNVELISDTSFRLIRPNGTADTVVIQWWDGNLGDVTTTGHRSIFTINNGAVTNAKVATGIDAAKIADGSVSNTEYQYLNSVTSNVQTQIDSKQATLVSGTNIKTVNGNSLVGSGNVTIASGSTNDFRQLKFTIGVSAYAPSAGDSILIYPSYVGKKLIIFREHDQISDSNSAYGYFRSGDTIKFRPAFFANEEFVIHAYPDSNWTTDNLVDPSSGYDADAVTYFNAISGAGGSLTTGQKDAVNAFILGEKADGLFPSYYDGMYITCLGSAAAIKFNVVDPVDADASYRLTFNNGATYASTGVSANGTNQTISTHFIPGAGGVKMGVNDSHVAVYQRTSTGVDNPVWGINQSGSQVYLFPKESGGNGAFKYTNQSNISFTPANAKGFWMTRKNATNILLDKDAVNINNGLDNGNAETLSTSYDIVFNGWNNNGTPALSHAAEIGFISFGKYMTDTQATNHKTRVVTLLTALGAN